MLIDWFTVVAQVINFLILVSLMKRFLYGPILRAIDAREKKIAAELSDADAKRAQAKQERDDFAAKNAELDNNRSALINAATQEADALRQRLLGQAQQAADDFSAKRQQSMKADARNLNQALILRTQQEVFSIARKTLADLASVSLEDQMSDAFNKRLKAIKGAEKAALTDALTSSAEPAIVRSAFALTEKQRTAIQQSINQTFAANVNLRFDTAPEIISGIELTTGGNKLAWSIADYLTSLESSISELLHVDPKTGKDLPTKSDATENTNQGTRPANASNA